MKPAQTNTARKDPTQLKAAGKRGTVDRHIEVQVETNADGSRQVVLRDLSYGPGLGWYPQKTIRLDPQQVEALMGALCCARQGVQQPSSETCPGEPTTRSTVIRIEPFLEREKDPGDRPAAGPRGVRS